MAIQKELEDSVRHVAPKAEFHLRVVRGRMSGEIVAPEFTEWTHLERQTRVWERLRQDLGPQVTELGTLLLYSPEEADAVEED